MVGGTLDVFGGHDGGAVLLLCVGIFFGVHLVREGCRLRVVVVPYQRVVDVEGQHITRVVADIVAGTYEVRSGFVRISLVSVFVSIVGQSLLSCEAADLRGQQRVTLVVLDAANLTLLDDGIGLAYESCLLCGSQGRVVPEADGLVELIVLTVDFQRLLGVIAAQFLMILVIVSIVVGLHVGQRETAVGTSLDGQRDGHRLRVGRSGARVGRDVLVVDVDSTLDVPVVCR